VFNGIDLRAYIYHTLIENVGGRLGRRRPVIGLYSAE
jgi:hypothetical protein